MKVFGDWFGARQASAPANAEKHRFTQELRDLQRQMESAQSLFANETDEDLLDAAIYQMQALQARYRHLLRAAKENAEQKSSAENNGGFA
ncbi:MAG: YaaL family protein [Oscillospiraceae bacterium]|nr:YaaL family protein [Oscillospiraceae bacterium]